MSELTQDEEVPTSSYQEALHSILQQIEAIALRLDRIEEEIGIARLNCEIEDDLEDDEEDFDLEDALDAREMRHLFMHSMDLIFNVLQATHTSANTLLSLAPEKEGVWRKRKPAWRIHFEKVVEGYSAGIETARDKMLAFLSDSDIGVIAPAIGSRFDPENHRAVERVSGGVSGHIAKVVRYGYSRKAEVLRPADVSVYL